jgi:signal transduction histidine kinase
MNSDVASSESLAAVLQAHEAALPIVAKLVASSSTKSASLQAEIEKQSRHFVNQSFLFLAPGVAIALIFALVTVKIASQLYRRMRWQAEELSRVSFHMLQGQEAVARRFSHELHDELGQSLTAVKANLVALTPENLAERRSDCLHVVNEAIGNVSELSQLLRPVILDDLGLDAGIRWLAEKFAQRTNIEVDYSSTSVERLPDDVETHLFRIAQEALTNVARHSHATRVTIELSQNNGRTNLKIVDNGRGFQSNGQTTRGLGLFGMRARAENAGGQLKLTASPGGGVSINASVPRERTTPSGAEEITHSAG